MVPSLELLHDSYDRHITMVSHNYHVTVTGLSHDYDHSLMTVYSKGHRGSTITVFTT